MTEEQRFVLDLPTAAMVGWWLEVRCCKGETSIPFKMLAEGRETVPLGDVVGKLRCRVCRQPPTSLAIAERADNGGGFGAKPRWRVVLPGRDG